MKKQIDLNCDMGESYGKYVSTYDEQIMPFISSCNIACGFHSGDPQTIVKTIELALRHNVAIGAHPSYPDLQGFGRRKMGIRGDELQACILYQLAALKGMTESLGGKLHHVKPHGALYNMAAEDEATASEIVEAILKTDPGLVIYTPHKSALAEAGKRKGLTIRCEVFADRCYENDSSLRPRSQKGAVYHTKEEVLAQTELMVLNGKVKTGDGKLIPVEAQTICLHSDTEGAAELSREIHDFLKSHEIEITSA